MSATPVPLLKSSSFRPGAGGCGGEDGFLFCPEEDRSAALRSSWICRLRLRPLPPPPATAGRSTSIPRQASHGGGGGGGGGHKHPTSTTDESATPASVSDLDSSIVRRSLSFLASESPPQPQPRLSPVIGFGPFQVRTRKALGRDEGRGMVLEKGKFVVDSPGEEVQKRRQGLCDGRQFTSMMGKESYNWSGSLFPGKGVTDDNGGARLSPFFKYQYPLADRYVGNCSASGGVRFARENGFSGPAGEGNAELKEGVETYSLQIQNNFRSVLNGNKHVLFTEESVNESQCRWPCQLHLGPGIPGSSVQRVAINQDVHCHGGAIGLNGTRIFREHHVLHHNNVLPHLQRQSPACLPESEEPFSFWNMGRFKSTNYVSSFSPAASLNISLGRKRNAQANDFIFSKTRRLGNEG